MKTNYDHIVEGGTEALADVIANHTCQDCSFCADCKTEGYNLSNCAQGIAWWLEQPYIEPDSWEKWEADVKLGNAATYEVYWNCVEIDCADCPSKILGHMPFKFYGARDCEVAMDADLLKRAKKLRSVE